MYAGNADSIKIESEDNGFHMIVETDEGTFSFLVHGVAVELLQEVQRDIGPWYAEGQAVLASMHRGPQGDFRCASEDIDESGGYALTDPKHPDFHSVHADIWDARSGK